MEPSKDGRVNRRYLIPIALFAVSVALSGCGRNDQDASKQVTTEDTASLADSLGFPTGSIAPSSGLNTPQSVGNPNVTSSAIGQLCYFRFDSISPAADAYGEVLTAAFSTNADVDAASAAASAAAVTPSKMSDYIARLNAIAGWNGVSGLTSAVQPFANRLKSDAAANSTYLASLTSPTAGDLLAAMTGRFPVESYPGYGDYLAAAAASPGVCVAP